ncbi:recombinase RecQ [Amycolatopsis regifaucium]|uniref:ATP-dependent DNA helicase RecQ n=1 Tax=Amycolatopsis regifaucium TaxID=546365 RepID=A0A154MPC3_9PSEU|nr:recombinase RecQ [Amycolatopsis regifaucium]OKA05034.1 recombinase RecQ [Amycolatopsis regifaucium]SFH79685.1 ATP-dependent DNA helicase RecQ [Amycolatopsis regifaucium]
MPGYQPVVTATERHEELQRVAAEVFGWPELSGEQLEAMEQIMAGHDVLVVLPTGAGKSAIYQVPAMKLAGVTLVVSPLIALQNDQRESIEASHAPEAVAVNSSQRAGERKNAWKAIEDGKAKYLFLSPEQMSKKDVLDTLAELDISLIAIDEAHCVSAWGHDFRPDYLCLAPVIEQLGHPPVLALTATAALPVREEIVERLGLRDHREVIAGFDRPNLHLAVERFSDDEDKRHTLITLVRSLTKDPGTGLVYVASRKDAEYFADELARAGVRAAAYHAGMKTHGREQVHERFLDGEVDVVVATSAFGMGIDKPDVRFVLHASVPDSLDTYYQQIGRAGRDGEPATITLLYRPQDLGLQKFLTAAKAPEELLGQVAKILREHGSPVRPAFLKDTVDASAARCTKAVNLLEEVGAVRTTGDGRLEYVGRDLPPDQAARQAVEVAERHQRLVRSRIEMIRGYAETMECRRRYLLGYFGERLAEPCGNCDTCDFGTGERKHAEDAEYAVNSTVRHVEWGEGTVMSVEPDRITILFDDFGYKTLDLAAVDENDLLTGDDTTTG